MHPDDDSSKVNYYETRTKEDPFPNLSLLDPIDKDQHEDVKNALDELKKSARKQNLADIEKSNLKGILLDHMNIFHNSISSGSGAKHPPMKIDLTPDAKSVKAKLCKYSQDEKDLMKKFVGNLVDLGLAYVNPTCKWACAPLLVLKPSDTYRFMIDVRPFNIFSVKQHYPILTLKHELTKVRFSKFFANFDMSTGSSNYSSKTYFKSANHSLHRSAFTRPLGSSTAL